MEHMSLNIIFLYFYESFGRYTQFNLELLSKIIETSTEKFTYGLLYFKSMSVYKKNQLTYALLYFKNMSIYKKIFICVTSQ